MSTTPLLLDVLTFPSADSADRHLRANDPLIIPLRQGEVVDVLIQNSRALNNVSEQHPWHLHGHSFWVLGHGMGKYNATKDVPTLNFVDPPYRDMVTVFPFGWTMIRFQTDNPGVWPFHCHIEPHALMGMALVFLEDTANIAPLPPDGFPLCGRLTDFSPRLASVFGRGRRDYGDTKGLSLAVDLLAVFLTLSVLVNIVLLLRKTAAFDVVMRRVLAISSPSGRRRKEKLSKGVSGATTIPTESPNGSSHAAEHDGDIEMPAPSPVGRT